MLYVYTAVHTMHTDMQMMQRMQRMHPRRLRRRSEAGRRKVTEEKES
jgi:hypothetical protein